MNTLKISKVRAREIIDSRGNPTIESEVTLNNGIMGRGVAPSGASTGKFEAYELRDLDLKRYGGKGVLKAVNNVNDNICKALSDRNPFDIKEIDDLMIKLDNTKNKKAIGANSILSVSIATCRAAAKSDDISLYKFLGDGDLLPVPMMNILNGGAHADNKVDTQEFMIVPVGSKTYPEGLRWCTQVFHELKSILKTRGMVTAVGDEGGVAPNISGDEEAIELILEAVKSAGFKPGEDFMISIDAAASEWTTNKPDEYLLPKTRKNYSSDDLVEYWGKICDKFPIFSIEDPLDEEDWGGWKKITDSLGEKVMLVGDDLFVTNKERLQKGIDLGCGNAILIKPNQIGSVSETIETINIAKESGFMTIISHRSGETEDTFIADLAVATNAGYIKSGAPNRSERVCKYNQLLRINEELDGKARYNI